MRVDPEFLRQIDPRKSYTRGPLALPALPVTAEPGPPASRSSAAGHTGSRALARMSIAELRTEIRRRQRSVEQLLVRRESLERKLAALDSELAALGLRRHDARST